MAPGNEANLTVSLEPDGQSLHVVGAAEWMSRAMESSGPHTGEVDGSGRPQGNRLVVGDAGACVLELYLLGEDTLFAVDHHSCGGMNVTFDGLY